MFPKTVPCIFSQKILLFLLPDDMTVKLFSLILSLIY